MAHMFSRFDCVDELSRKYFFGSLLRVGTTSDQRDSTLTNELMHRCLPGSLGRSGHLFTTSIPTIGHASGRAAWGGGRFVRVWHHEDAAASCPAARQPTWRTTGQLRNDNVT